MSELTQILNETPGQFGSFKRDNSDEGCDLPKGWYYAKLGILVAHEKNVGLKIDACKTKNGEFMGTFYQNGFPDTVDPAQPLRTFKELLYHLCKATGRTDLLEELKGLGRKSQKLNTIAGKLKDEWCWIRTDIEPDGKRVKHPIIVEALSDADYERYIVNLNDDVPGFDEPEATVIYPKADSSDPEVNKAIDNILGQEPEVDAVTPKQTPLEAITRFEREIKDVYYEFTQSGRRSSRKDVATIIKMAVELAKYMRMLLEQDKK